MKIDDLDSGSKVPKYQSEVKPGIDRTKKSPEKTVDQVDSPADNVQLSERSQEITGVQEAVEAAPEIRQDKVEAVKARLADGSYEVNSEKVADRILKSSLQEIA
ncbi:MAG: flagellar biosynthesis anti-sigma factor FlgM [Candidatus Adiutricales bacterium]